MEALDDVLQLLSRRKWTLYQTDKTKDYFITNDAPVVIAYTDPTKYPSFLRYSPGHALEDTQVYFPLTRNAFLIGRWTGEDQTVEAGQPFIAAVNQLMIWHSGGQVFSHKPAFLYFDPLMRLKRDDQAISSFTRKMTPEEKAEFVRKFGPKEE